MNFIVSLVIYPFDVMVSIGEEDSVLHRRLEKYGIPKDELYLSNYSSETCQGRGVLFSSNQTLIRIRRAPSIPADYGYLQHEIFHAVTFILDRIGMTLSLQSSDEAYAYLIQYLTTEIYTKMKIRK